MRDRLLDRGALLPVSDDRGEHLEDLAGILPLLREHRDRLRVPGERLLERLPVVLDVHLPLLVPGIEVGRHLPAEVVAGDQLLGAGLKAEHEPTVRVEPGHEAVLDIHRGVALDVHPRGVAHLERGAVDDALERLALVRPHLLVHLEREAEGLAHPAGQDRLRRADLRVHRAHERLDATAGDHARVGVAGADLGVAGAGTQLLVEVLLLRERLTRNVEPDTTHARRVARADHRVRAERHVRHVGRDDERSLDRLVRGLHRQQREARLGELDEQDIIELPADRRPRPACHADEALPDRVPLVQQDEVLDLRHHHEIDLGVVVRHHLEHRPVAELEVLTNRRGVLGVQLAQVVGVHEDLLEQRRDPPVAVDLRVAAHRVEQPDDRGLPLPVDVHPGHEEAVRQIPVGPGEHLRLKVRRADVPLDDLRPHVRPPLIGVLHHVGGVAVDRRQRGDHFSEVARRHVDHVRRDRLLERAGVGEHVRGDVGHPALTNREHLRHAGVALRVPCLHAREPRHDLGHVRHRVSFSATMNQPPSRPGRSRTRPTTPPAAMPGRTGSGRSTSCACRPRRTRSAPGSGAPRTTAPSPCRS